MDSIEIARKTIKNHLDGSESNNNKISAAVGLLNSESTNLLILATTSHGGRIVEAGKNLENALDEQVNKTINSNKNLAESNNKYAKAMRILTVALVIVGILQVYVSWKALKFQQEQQQEQNQRNEVRDNCIRNGHINCP